MAAASGVMARRDETNKKMNKIFIHVAGNTLHSHEQFVQKLLKRGAEEVNSPKDSNVSIVFCPIVSRFETDKNSALSSASELDCKDVILVAMHHTFDKDYPLPKHREQSDPAVILQVDCLFFETKGLLTCSRNENALEMVCERLGLKPKWQAIFGKMDKVII